jgi:hypothetical protein
MFFGHVDKPNESGQVHVSYETKVSQKICLQMLADEICHYATMSHGYLPVDAKLWWITWAGDMDQAIRFSFTLLCHCMYASIGTDAAFSSHISQDCYTCICREFGISVCYVVARPLDIFK